MKTSKLISVSCFLSVGLFLALPAAVNAQFLLITNADNTITVCCGGVSTYDLVGDVTIPSSTNGYPVTKIGAWGFDNCYYMTSVTIPGSVTSIGDYAFTSCHSLTNVSLGNGITSIGDGAFSGCASLTSVTIPDSVTDIGNEAFAESDSLTNISVSGGNSAYASLGGVLFNKSLTTLIQYPIGITNASYVVPTSVTRFGFGAFQSCWNLKSVTIPGSVTSIDYAVFDGCENLTSVTIPNGVITIGFGAFEECSRLASVAIPDSVTSIGDEAFGASGMTYLTNVVIGTGLTNLGMYAFDHCINLHQVYFQGDAPSVDGADGSVDNTVFSGESGTVYYQQGATGWGATFGGWPTAVLTNLASDFIYITNQSTLTIVGYVGAGGNVTIPNTFNGYSVTTIGTNAFYNKAVLTSVTIPLSVTNISDLAFDGCSGLTSVTIPSSVTCISTSPFRACSTLTYIAVDAANPAYAGAGGVLCDKTQTTVLQYPPGLAGSYAIPSSVANIGPYAFATCSGLTNVTIPSSVTNIGAFAFADCTALEKAYFQGNSPSVNGGAASADSTVFRDDSGTVYYLCATTGWGSTFGGWPAAPLDGPCDFYTPTTCFTYITNNGSIWITGYICSNPVVSIPPSINGSPVTCIGTFAFYTNSVVTSVLLPNSITGIGDYAFFNCPNLATIMIPASVTNIGYVALSFCLGLTNISVASQNASYTSVAGVLFDKNETTLLQCPGGFSGSYVVPAGVASIGPYSFNGTMGLTSVIIGDSVTNIGDSAFYFCPALTNVSIARGLANLGPLVFGDCASLVAISVDAQNPFYSSVDGVLFNKNQTVIVQYPGGIRGAYGIPPGVTTVGEGAFWACSVTSVTFPASVANLAERAFGGCSRLTGAYFMGNAPSADPSIFQGDSGTVYYLPGTTGWKATYGGLPTALWTLPRPVVLNSGLGVQNNLFVFTVSWATNTSVVVEASTDLQAWTPVTTNTLVNGTSYFSDRDWTRYADRFYRVRPQ